MRGTRMPLSSLRCVKVTGALGVLFSKSERFKMFRKIFTSLLVLLGLSSCKTSTPVKAQEVDLVDLSSLAVGIAGDEPALIERLSLFVNDRRGYFQKYEDDLHERGIESGEDVSIEIALIDGLIEVEKIAYVDHAYEADQSLILLDRLSNSKLSQNECFSQLQDAYKKKGEYNAIGNFMHDEKIGPMPYACIEANGFYLASIDESSDSYPLILVKKDGRVDIEAKAKSLGVNIKFFGR
ncbi:DUF6630 family protein [Vreelandella alkaliphila]|uniref:DUF6630 family protein n=1 Tax=Vreelandella alkaliphila TaxID=272774 RepID=UPI003FD84185